VLWVLGLLGLALLVYAVLDVVTTPRDAVQVLPKPLWLLLVLAPVFGPVLWFFFGRPPRGTARQPLRPGSAAAPGAPDDDDEFLRELRRRADEQRRRARDPRDD
jgi:hypothetical protein